MDTRAAALQPGQTVALDTVPELPVEKFRNALISAVARGCSLCALFATPAPNDGLQLVAVLAAAKAGHILIARAPVGAAYPCLTLECPAANWFEREIAEQWGVQPQGHPWLKPIRFQRSYRADVNSKAPLPGVTDYFAIQGAAIHEVAVGPVHAGIIEPGHFRFQCYGEEVFHLEVALGYQHRGVEQMLVGGPGKRTLHLVETLCGDTTIGHTLAYAEALEALSGTAISARAEVLRAIALELERLANHTGDLGALAADVGYLPSASYCGRIRGEFLNLTATLCGNRFGRAMVRPGGVGFDLGPTQVADFRQRLKSAFSDLEGAVNLLWDRPSVQARFEDTGVLSRETCVALGLVGPAARACGVERDVRRDFPTGAFRRTAISASTSPSGDVFARAWVRWLEIQRSIEFVHDQLSRLPEGEIASELMALRPGHIATSLVEGWRGEICHVAVTGSDGRLASYKVVDPSFHNWLGLAIAMRGQQISDFPLCNKSFDLSYCGHDL